MSKIVTVTVKFRYEKEKNKDDSYYIQKAFDEIYNTDDNLTDKAFNVRGNHE